MIIDICALTALWATLAIMIAIASCSIYL